MYSIQLVRYKTCNIVLMAMESRPVSYMAMKLLNLLSLQIVVGQGTRGKLTQTYRCKLVTIFIILLADSKREKKL